MIIVQLILNLEQPSLFCIVYFQHLILTGNYKMFPSVKLLAVSFCLSCFSLSAMVVN